MKIAFSPKAESDLEEIGDYIGDYIARDNPARASTFLDELRDACLAIAAAPEAWPALPEFGPAIRRAVHRRYLLFYSIQTNEIRVERILHGARDVSEDLV